MFSVSHQFQSLSQASVPGDVSFAASLLFAGVESIPTAGVDGSAARWICAAAGVSTQVRFTVHAAGKSTSCEGKQQIIVTR